MFILFVIIVVIKKSPRSPKLNLPPGRHGWPILGETMEFLNARMDGCPQKFFKERVEKYKSRVFKTSLMGQSVAVLCGPSGNKFLFGNENKLVTVWWPSSVRKILGTCISTTGGIQGMQMRKMISYFVTPDAFTKLYIKKMDIVARQHINTHWEGKEGIKVFPAIRQYTFEVACRLFMSVEEPAQIGKLAELFNVFIKGVISIPFNIPGTRFFKAKRATTVIRKELQVIVRQRIVDLEHKTAIHSQDLLSHLLAHPDENGTFMSEAVIINNILMLLFAGHDTTSSALTMLIKYLADNPQVYERVFAEQREIALSKEAGEYLQWEDLQKMRYSWNVACEAMRLSPPLIGAFREALVDINYGGYDIPKGWKLYWSSSLTHRDPSFFEEPTNFEPSRFEGSGPTPFSYVPFGGGPRMCLGKEFARLEILIFLHNIVTRFRWGLVDHCESIGYDPIPTPVRGLPISLHPHPLKFSPK
ncbi:beta-amyrin 28-oxidase [Phtheirospermum japonicum]|uniref:Beta-amyrin 28-oxidase n=1 Tax=Phtheirospermum japonicum TaxID=374723 RepID=A0A830C7V7_9LAMI|nr:beta-amyrin 28-oxidase [Phtheirospermum japonicum]